MTNAREDAADASRLRLLLSERDRELDLLRSCLHCVREDLNVAVKNEQFDYLYASLKASSEFSAAERAAAEAAATAESRASIQALRARVNFLERVVSDQARRLGEKPSHRAERDKWGSKSASAGAKHGGMSLTAAGNTVSKAAMRRTNDTAYTSNARNNHDGSSREVNDGTRNLVGSATTTSRNEFGPEVAFTNAAAASVLDKKGSNSRNNERKHTYMSLLMLDDELLRHCMAFASASDLATLAIVSGPALCAIARGEQLWHQLYCYIFGNPQRRGCLGKSSNVSAKRYPSSSSTMMSSSGEWFRTFTVRATAERRWKKGAAQSVVLRGHSASGGFGSAATVTCLATRFERRFLVSGGDDGSLAFWHLARRPAQTQAFTFQSAKTYGSSKGSNHSGGGGGSSSSRSSSSVYRDDGRNTDRGATASERLEKAEGGSGGSRRKSVCEEEDDDDDEEVMLRPPPALALAQLATGESSSRSSRSSSSNSSSVFNGSLGSVMEALRVSGSGLSSGNYVGNTSGGSGGSEGIGLGTGGNNSFSGSAGNSSIHSMGSNSGGNSNAIDDGGGGHYLEFEKMRAFHGHGGPVWCLALDEYRNRLVSGSYDRTVKVWDLHNGSCLRTLRGHAGWVSCVGIVGGAYPRGPNGAIVSGSWDATIKVWDNNDGPPAQDPLRTTLHCGVGNALYCLDSQPTNHPPSSSFGSGDGDAAAATSSSSNLVAVGCRQRHVQVWDISTESQVLRCEGHQKEVGALHWASPAFMVTGSGDSTVKAWDPRLDHRNGTCTATLRGHSGAVMCVSADVDRHRVVSGGVDKSVMTWDLRKTDQPLLVHAYSQVHQGAVFAVNIDGDRIVSGGADGRIGILNFSY